MDPFLLKISLNRMNTSILSSEVEKKTTVLPCVMLLQYGSSPLTLNPF